MVKKKKKKLHADLLTFWNNQDAKGMASLCSDNANMIGFDGSEMNGQIQIEKELKEIFSHHKTAKYVWKVKEVRQLNSEVALLRAIVGMVPPGKEDINPATNAIQSLIAFKENSTWRISLFQNTPAQFDGRPELVDQMTKELSELL